jgi:hypothetical protein
MDAQNTSHAAVDAYDAVEGLFGGRKEDHEGGRAERVLPRV